MRPEAQCEISGMLNNPESSFTRAYLSEAQLGRANLSAAQLGRANLSEAQFYWGRIVRMCIQGALNFSGPHFTGAQLSQAH